MAKQNVNNARLFLRSNFSKLDENYHLVTAHLVIRDAHNRFFFVEKETNAKSNGLNYDIIDYDTIVINNYPDDQNEGVPELEFFYSTDTDECKEYKDFELFVLFRTKSIYTDKKALVIVGKESSLYKGSKPTVTEPGKETDKGIVYFPDVTL